MAGQSPSSCSVADAPSGGRINGELLRSGVDVSANVKRILDSWVTQLMSLGRTAAHQSHLQKGSVRIEHLERVLMRTSFSLETILSDVKCHSLLLQTFSFKWRVGGLSLSLRSFNYPPPSPFTTFSTGFSELPSPQPKGRLRTNPTCKKDLSVFSTLNVF